MFTLRFAIAPGLIAVAVLASCSGEVPSSQPVAGAAGNGGGANAAGGTSSGGSTGPASGAPGSSGNAAGGAASQTTGGAPGGGQSAGGSVASQGGATGTTGGVGASGSAGASNAGASNLGGSTSAGGTSSSGTSSGGTAAGGLNSGGKSQGSGGTTSTGGTSAGGTAGASGASTTGGMSAGGAGACVPATCGSHKWPCWKMPNPPTSPASVPNHQTYTDLGNGAVRDDITCLVWEKANPAASTGNWQYNFNRCAALGTSTYAGFNDWRMPTRVEMASITDVTLGATGYPRIFTVTGGYYLTGSFWYKTILTASGSTPEDRVWGYGKNGFTSNAIIRSDSGNVTRCVRGNGSGEAAGTYAMAPANHYTVTSGVVTDNYTGLSWQQTFSSGRMAWSAAAGYCSSQTTGGLSGWRVPTLNELASTVNEALVAPAIDRTAFPNTIGGCGQTDWYWAAEASKVGGTAWGISYCDGYTGWNAASAEWNTFPDAYVRCVR